MCAANPALPTAHLLSFHHALPPTAPPPTHTHADVYALAVTLNELGSGAAPYADCTRDNPLAHTVLEMGYGRWGLGGCGRRA